MNTGTHIDQKRANIALWFIIFTGTILRVIVFLQNRSLIIDEANLARNIAEKEIPELFGSLDYEQFAPPLFSILSKASVAVFGMHEYSLRLLPFVAGVTTLFLLIIVSKRLINHFPSQLYMLSLLAFSDLAVRYSTEFKQYSTDAALAMAFILWAIHSRGKSFKFSLAFTWGILGSVAIWFSMPVIFVLAAVGIAFLYKSFRESSSFVYLLIPGIMWIASFGLYFFAVLQPDAQSEYLQSFHQQYFIDLFPENLAEFQFSLTRFKSFLATLTDKTVLGIIWALIALSVGSIALVKEDKFAALLLLLPGAFCMIAAHLHLYSLIDRLILFLVPAMLVIMAAGVKYIWTNTGFVIRSLMAILMIISLANQDGYQYFIEKFQREDSKSVMQYISDEMDEGDFIYVHHGAVPAFHFYNNLYVNAWDFDNYHLAKWDENILQIIKGTGQVQNGNTFWMVLLLTVSDEEVESALQEARQHATLINTYHSVRTATYRFRLN